MRLTDPLSALKEIEMSRLPDVRTARNKHGGLWKLYPVGFRQEGGKDRQGQVMPGIYARTNAHTVFGTKVKSERKIK